MTSRLWTLPLATMVAAVALAGCTEPDDPGPTGSGSSSSAPSSSTTTGPKLEDRSAQVVDPAAARTAIATTKGKSSSTFRGATFTFYQLTRSDASTLLVWTVTGGSGSNATDANDAFWERYPRLRTKDSEYSIVTFDDDTDGWTALSNPVLKLTPGKESSPQSAIYPPLPAGTTSVTVRSAWFDDVTVPVSAAS